MISRQGTLLEKNVEKIFKLAKFNTRRNPFINGYEVDVLAQYDVLKIAIQCKQYEKSKLNIRDLIHQWESKSKKINVDRVLIVIYGNQITFQDVELAKEYGIYLWGENELDEVEDYVMNNKDNSTDYILNKLNIINEDDVQEEPEVKKVPFAWIIVGIVLFLALISIPFVGLIIAVILVILIIFFRIRKISSR